MDPTAPTVLWRLSGAGPHAVRAVILPGGPPYTLAFFAGDQLDRAENYDTMELTLFRADEIKRSMAADGWMED